MGKAQIISHTGAGLYSATILLDRVRALAAIAKIDIAVATLTATIATLTSEIAAQQVAYDAAKAQTSPVTPFSQLLTMMTAINVKAGRKALYELEKSSKEAKKRQLQSIAADETISAWCADKTEDLAGTVGTIEPNGEPSGYIIQPGYAASGASPAVYDRVRDGQIQPLLSNTPEATFFNKAMMPGWQKWMPTYRVGTITALDTVANIASVALDAVNSREQPKGSSLDINYQTTLAGIPVEYMT